MKHLKKSIVVFMMVLTLLLTAAGCTKKTETPVDNTPKEKVKVTVMSWWNYSQSKPLQELKSKFEEKNKDIELEFQQIPSQYADKVMTVVAGGGDQVPDVMMLAMDVIPRFAKAGAIQPLDDLMTDSYKKSLYPVVLDALKFNGKIYAAPRDITSFVMFCNKKLFADVNVDLPKEGWTWNDFLETCKKLTKTENGKATQWGYYFPKNDDAVFTWLIQNGASYTTADAKESTMSKPEAKQALQFLQDLILKYKVCPTETEAKQFGTDSSAPFIAGKVAMETGGLSMSVSLDTNKMDYVMVPLPKGSKQATTAFVNSWTIPKGAKHTKEAWKVIEFFSSKEGQQIVLDNKMGMPASKDVDISAFLKQRADNKVLVDSLTYGIPFQTLEYGAKYYDLSKKTLELIWLGQKSVDDGTKEIDEKAKDILAGK